MTVCYFMEGDSMGLREVSRKKYFFHLESRGILFSTGMCVFI